MTPILRLPAPRWRRLLLSLGLPPVGAAALLLVEAALARAGEVSSSPSGSPDGAVGEFAGSPINLTVLGDSTGAAVGATDVERGYPRLIARALAAEARRPVRLTVLSVSGARIADVRRDQLPSVASLEPDLVLIAAGGNDVTHLTSRRAARRDLRAVIRVCAAGGATVVVAGIPAMGTTRRAAQPLRTLLRLVAWRLDAIWCQETRASRSVRIDLAAGTGPAFASDRSLFSADLFHPSDAGYAVWAAVLGEGVIRAHRLRSATRAPE